MYESFLSSFKNFIKGLKPINKHPKVTLVIGVTGGGTTLVSSLLDQNFCMDSVVHESQLRFSGDSHFKGKFPRLYHNFEDYRLEMIYGYKNGTLKRFKKELIKIYKSNSGFKIKVNTIVDKSPSYHCYRIDYYLKAFRDVKVIVIFRDPKENVEGMLRKWEIFKSAGIHKIGEFWKDSFENILKYEKELKDNIVFVDLNDLKESSNGFVETIERKFDFKRRQKLKIYNDKPNNKGKALRNVNNGLIMVDKTKQKLDLICSDKKIIDNICLETYKKLLKRKVRF